MAKTSMLEREKKRTLLINKHFQQRADIKERLRQLYKLVETQQGDMEQHFHEIEKLQYKLQALPRNSSPNRQRQRCKLTGRSRGVYSKFGLCKSKLRELAMLGWIPGLVKSSW